ncbi:MerR family transcriptional regulator [Paracoccus seriniphilus]|uniref:DNA-binding transcriptional regulator, MerR family n=1 Tax=Paracoccus seriniphilus TaxID=184748 RepID=A0A239PZL3_9RHOB|nr:helix-turn-helix domain-containing protein [Paracoccus seriniphilus]WCR16016.1 helix-turn-helix domain-containing protein [Paracoccus seriniphilus]SNT75453.1 DNA-binding transcriptional regulator, MerR family [Paracoccus seriniphilus]
MQIGIGALSRETGIKVPTIRYYEKIGLVPEGDRTAGNQRRYDQADIDRLRFIRHARALGFDLAAIRELLAMSEKPQASCHEADSIAREHLAEVDRRIAQLQALREELGRMISECSPGRICDCKVINVLADHANCLHDQH